VIRIIYNSRTVNIRNGGETLKNKLMASFVMSKCANERLMLIIFNKLIKSSLFTVTLHLIQMLMFSSSHLQCHPKGQILISVILEIQSGENALPCKSIHGELQHS
jgi:hypothetical protein